MNEKLVSAAMKISKRIELVTRLNLYNEQFASENYQIMNYGIGGKITPHVDSIAFKYDENYSDATNSNLLQIITKIVF